MISQLLLKRYINDFPDSTPRVFALEQRIQIGTGFHKKWYRSQKEHWLGWMEHQAHQVAKRNKSEAIAPGSIVWNRLKCSPAMFWLAECSGVSEERLQAAERAAVEAASINPKDGDPHGRLMRAEVPWSVIETALQENAPKSSVEDANKAAGLALERLARLRSDFRQYLEPTG